MRYVHILVFVGIVFILSPLHAQEGYEDLLESEGSVSDQSEILERIEELERHPLDINAASAVELQRIPWLSPVQTHSIVNYRNETGHFRSIQQLLQVPGFDESLVAQIIPLVTVKVESPLPPVSGRIRARMIVDHDNDGIAGNTFLFGEKVYTQVKLNISDRFNVDVLTEKDPCERSLNDHVVYSISFDRFGRFDRIHFGHIRLDFGQGLVLGNYSGAVGGAAFPLSLKKREQGIRAYTSTLEAFPLFGLACSGYVKGIAFSLFGSKADVDATLNDDGTVSSIYDSGLHRTENERNKRDVLEEKLYGVHVSHPLKQFGRAGITWYQSRYSRAFDPKDSERKHYTFRGQFNSVGGLNFDVQYRRLMLFGEAAKTSGAGHGMLIGAIIDFDNIEMATLVRAYSKEFYNLRNYAFAQDPEETQNESGAILGMKFRPHRNIRLKSYIDVMRNPWRRYYEKMPPAREEWWSQIEHRCKRRIRSEVRLRIRTKNVNKKVNDDESKNTRRRQINVRGQIDWKCSRGVQARGRWERVWVNYPDLLIQDSGWLLFGDLRLMPTKWFILDNRVIMFNTDSYDARLYTYEHDLPGTMSNPGLYGHGWRWYTMIRFNPGWNLRFSFKYALTRFLEDGKEDDHTLSFQFECSPTLWVNPQSE